jgi:hypothetical protein
MGGGPNSAEGNSERAEQLIGHLQKIFGYSLSAENIRKGVFAAYGSGNND